MFRQSTARLLQHAQGNLNGKGALLVIAEDPKKYILTATKRGWDHPQGLGAVEDTGNSIFRGTLESHPFRENTFDLILIISNVRSDIASLQQLSRACDLLTPGGLLYFQAMRSAHLQSSMSAAGFANITTRRSWMSLTRLHIWAEKAGAERPANVIPLHRRQK